MTYLSFGLICFLASAVGAVCGMGGGVIIKPALDAFGVLDSSVISFLSGCTVLSMSFFSILINKCSESSIELRQGTLLAGGSVFGGFLGERLLSLILALSGEAKRLGEIQAVCLLIVTVCILVYFFLKNCLPSYQVKNRLACISLGVLLGLISSFLGIGGGPINLAVLYFGFSMSAKEAARTSLYLIFFSQTANLLSAIAAGTVPVFEPRVLVFMVLGGILGGIGGRILNRRINEKKVEILIIIVMLMIIFINIYNIFQFAA